MSELKDIVPPLELCKLIPAGSLKIPCWCGVNESEIFLVMTG